MGERSILSYFPRFLASGHQKALLDAATDVVVRADREKRMAEVRAFFGALIEKNELYRIEDGIASAYELSSMRVLPRYPSELFTLEYFPQIFAETEKIGMVSRGFFDINRVEQNGDAISIFIPFTKDGIKILQSAKTDRVIEGIIKSEFGLTYSVTIKQSNDFEEIERKRRAEYDDTLRYYMTHVNEAPPPPSSRGSEGGSHFRPNQVQRKAPEIDPSFTKKSSLYDGEAHYRERGDGIIEIGNKVFDISSPELLTGDVFDILEPTPLKDITPRISSCICVGEVFKVSLDPTRKGDKIRTKIFITDGEASLEIREILKPEDSAWAKSLKAGTCVALHGKTRQDDFDGETVMQHFSVMKIKRVSRKDTSSEKRVELHLHTNMSQMDAIITPEQVINTAAAWGHKAIAVTDHGNVQAFPEIMLAHKKAKKNNPDLDLKIIYGMEGYFVDDQARAVYGDARPTFDDEFIVFDIETTGLVRSSDRITEFGAVLVKGGEVLDSFSCFVNPEMPIPPHITELTGISDDMVRDAETIDKVLPRFLEFIGDRMLVAHNANFDVGFVRAAAENLKIPFNNSYIDTVPLARYIVPELKRVKLDTLAEFFEVGEFDHHRAYDDALTLSKVFYCMVKRLREAGQSDVTMMLDYMSANADPLKLPMYHIVLLAKDATGLKNLYKLISESYLSFYRKKPRIPRTLLDQYREGIIVGSACDSGELYKAILDQKPDAEIEKIASYYDYLEIQPLCNCMHLLSEGSQTVSGVEELKNINRKIIALGKKLDKPVCATCDAHFLEKEDEIYRKILLAGMGFKDADSDVGIYLRTTEEMLAEFDYLDPETAREVVITNPNKIAEQVQELLPIPDGQYTPNMEGAEEELQRLCWDRARKMYGDPIPEIVSTRLQKELDSIIKHGFAVLYMIAVKLVSYSESLGYLVGSRGSVGSSFVATMSGISEVNPLAPHYYCTECQYSEFITDGSVGSGFDLPDKNCPRCGKKLAMDGHDIPFETFLGFKGDKSPDIDLNFSGDVQGRVHKYTEELFGAGHVFRAGTIGTIAEKTAFGYVNNYLKERMLALPTAEKERLVSGCVGIKRTTGQHPGGIIVVPREYEIYDFTPVQHPADDPNSDIITTHFQFSYLHDTILKLDELGHDIPTKYKMLERYTNTSVMDVPMNTRAAYDLFASCEALGVTKDDIGCDLGTLGLPEMGTRFIQQVLIDAKPKNFADLMQISGLTHGTDVWLGNAQDLIKAGTCDISQVVGTRDGIMLYLIRRGLDNSTAFKIMEDVRKGRGLKPEYEEDMRAHDVPNWYIASCKKIKYMFPKAHAAAYVMSAIRLAWYKVYYPMEFYAAYFTVAPGGFDGEIVMKGREAVSATIKEIAEKGNEATQKEAETSTALMLAREALARGIKFLPVDLYKSDATAFLPEDGKIRLPFASLGGVGDTAARNIVEAREKNTFYSVEELRHMAGINKSVIEILTRNHVLDDLQLTNQMTFF